MNIKALLTYEITIKDCKKVLGEEGYARMRGSKPYKFVSDWAGLASNKVILGMYMDAKVGMLPGTSLMARGISLAFHTIASPIYTIAREKIYKDGNITPNRSFLMKQGAELLAFNAVQTPLYVIQIAAAMAMRAAVDDSVDFDIEKIATGAFKFFQHSWYLAPAGKASMDMFRRFFEVDTPEQVALEEIVK